MTKTFSFSTGLDGWTSSGTHCSGQHSPGDGSPPDSLSTTVSGKNRNATCTWTSPLNTWAECGVPATATALTVRLDAAATRVAACTSCQAGSIVDYRVVNGSGATLASVWGGRSLPAGTESWQLTAAQADQGVGAEWQAARSQLRLVLTANLRTGNSNSATVTLRQDEISLVIAYHP